eukprot:TRINITY_DN5499_c0_g1_i2.p1 TRINITY_DN5499_c0_g1~~TRINITY_DN5499_c0_g1_i2.p1  ORF type:complete len:119 (-),score=50.87 TRINITY_DN5499_c0_g1_i2:204-560(-)
MGACADLALIVSVLRFYALSRDEHRRYMLGAVGIHFAYVIGFFANCSMYPPTGKAMGLLMNTVAVCLAARYLQSAAGHSRHRFADALHFHESLTASMLDATKAQPNSPARRRRSTSNL